MGKNSGKILQGNILEVARLLFKRTLFWIIVSDW